MTADGHVQKTTRRHVVTLELDRFQAVEVHRQQAVADSPAPAPLAHFVPKGGTYGYDFMTHVGCETFLQSRQLQSLAHEFPRIPFSSLYDAQHKFLFYFGHFHRQSAPVLREWFLQHGGSTWLIDATLEAGTPMYFGVYEAQDNLFLDAYRIPSENADALSPCLRQTADRFGKPRRTLHDLSEAMAAACERALQGVPHRVCQFHFLRDIGEDLYAVPQARLRDRLRQLKLQRRLKEQRNTLTDWLREHLEHPRLLAEVLLGSRYLSDPEVIAAADQYEAAFSLFHRLRTTLRMAAQGDNPLRDRYLLDESDAAGVQQSLESFRLECRQRMEEETAEASRARYRIVCQHLDRYWNQLFAPPEEPCRERTTNGLEGWWGTSKRRCRQRHGRKKLTREFRSLPAEFMLIGNLENPKYVERVLDGDLSKLPEKLAAAGRTAGPWTTWRSAQQPLNEGRLPTRLIRHNQFLEELTTVYDAHCRKESA